MILVFLIARETIALTKKTITTAQAKSALSYHNNNPGTVMSPAPSQYYEKLMSGTLGTGLPVDESNSTGSVNEQWGLANRIWPIRNIGVYLIPLY